MANPPADNDAANRYWERREGMQAQLPAGSLVQGGRSVFPSTADAEIYFFRDDYAPLAGRADPYARRVFRDPHPLDDIPMSCSTTATASGSSSAPSASRPWQTTRTCCSRLPARTTSSPTQPAGGVYFGFSKYQIQVADQPTFSTGADPSLNGAPQAADPAFDWTSATYNVENLYDFRDDPTDGCDFLGNTGCPGVSPPFDFVPTSQADYDAQLTALATQIIEDLKAPDLILTQEGEDQDICSVVSGSMACGGASSGTAGPTPSRNWRSRSRRSAGLSTRPPTIAMAPTTAASCPASCIAPIASSSCRSRPATRCSVPHPASSTRPSTPLAYNADVQNPKALNTTLPTDLQPGSTLDGSNVFTRPPQVGHFRVWRDGIGTSVFIDVWAHVQPLQQHARRPRVPAHRAGRLPGGDRRRDRGR